MTKVTGSSSSCNSIIFLPEEKGGGKIRAVNLKKLGEEYSTSGSLKWGVGVRDCVVILITGVLCLGVIPLYKLVEKVCRCARDIFSKKVSSDTRQQRKALKQALNNKVMPEYNSLEIIGDESVSDLHTAAHTLRCCLAISKKKVDLSEIIKHVDDPKYDAGRGAEIEKAFKKGLSKEDKAKFKADLIKERGKELPAKLTHDFTVGGKKVRERTVSLDAGLGAKYLSLAGSYGKEIKYIKSHRHGSDWGQRCSEARVGDELQGMVINGRTHTISVGGKKVEETYRSGAFAVHGRGEIGLSRLKEMQQELVAPGADADRKKVQILSKLAKELGVGQKEVIKRLEAEIKYRTDMTVAQALPKICQSLKSMASDEKSLEMARKTGSFLHLEQSLLSDLEHKELCMIQDMKGALDHIREKVKVKFISVGDDKIELEKDGSVTITLKVDKAPVETFGVHTVFFTQGVNEFQSAGFAKFGAIQQDRINLEGLGHLLAYAKAAKKNLKSLREHYALDNFRSAKDLKGIDLVRETVKALGGRRGVVCKSAKDRTGFECSRALSKAVVKIIGEKHESAVHDKLVRGISLTITGHNTGKRKGYAFNIFQRRALPWDVPADACSSFVKS